jgi:hypothetical protein
MEFLQNFVKLRFYDTDKTTKRYRSSEGPAKASKMAKAQLRGSAPTETTDREYGPNESRRRVLQNKNDGEKGRRGIQVTRMAGCPTENEYKTPWEL